jgi:hypothetical protein
MLVIVLYGCIPSWVEALDSVPRTLHSACRSSRGYFVSSLLHLLSVSLADQELVIEQRVFLFFLQGCFPAQITSSIGVL